jgi:phage repressor protein C with HTH and peptisase S24 domain
METVGDRIAYLIKKKGMKQTVLAKKIGVSSQAVNQWISGSVKKISGENIVKLAKALQTTPEWIISGSASKGFEFGSTKTIIDAERVEESPPAPYDPVYSLGDEYVFIPRYEAGISAGHGYHNGDYVEISKTHAYRLDWIRKHSLHPEDLCVIEALGHSMEPRISDGDVLLVNRADKEFQSGKVYVLSFPNEGLRVKRIHRLADGRIKISSDNPDKAQYPDEYYSPEEVAHLNIVGKVVQRSGEI